jgi:hypothetical protein
MWPFVVGLLVSACGGDSAEPTSTEIVASGDVSATLSLVPGSLPEGVSSDDVQVTVQVEESGEPGAPRLAVQLLPDGLVLAEPATLTIPLPEALQNGFMAIHTSGDSIEFLDGDIIPRDNGVVAFEASVGHFSVVSFYDDSFVDVSLSVWPLPVAVGQQQAADALITYESAPVSLWLRFGSDPEGTVRLVEFSSPRSPSREEKIRFVWGLVSGRGFWDPTEKMDTFFVERDQRQIDSETKQITGTLFLGSGSKCVKANSLPHYFSSKVSFELALLSLGDPVIKEFIEVARGVSGSAMVPLPSIVRDGSVELLGISPGDTFEAVQFVSDIADSVCTESAVTTSTTSTTSTTLGEAPPSTSGSGGSSDGQSTEIGSVPGSTECPDSESDAAEVGDGRAHPEFVRVYLNELGKAYVHMYMCASLGVVPPDELFSYFWLLASSWNPTAEVGWEIHDGNVTVLGTMSEAYILADGSILVDTGLTPTGDFTITIDASYGSWVAEDGAPPVFGDTQFLIPAELVVVGDPFEEAGSEPVYNLIAGE